MKLPDFLQDEAFNRLRQTMKAEQLGSFELFDPEKQLTYAEREALEDGVLQVSGAALRVLKDKTLAFKNTRVWLKDQADYHLAYCAKVQSLRHRADTIDVGTGNTMTGNAATGNAATGNAATGNAATGNAATGNAVTGIPMVSNKGCGVCLECLSVLQYQGVDARRMRRAEFSDQIREQFSLADFKQTYPFYPIL
ncbi:hypothetical protein ACQUQU_11625 [Thalassolituus sp. LLYu03]|uniref:hypothetical protein n=1 Tax=Thalassolituus sp. LLYu03 TaxID=3421656 RepID=UPI003D29F2B1